MDANAEALGPENIDGIKVSNPGDEDSLVNEDSEGFQNLKFFGCPTTFDELRRLDESDLLLHKTLNHFLLLVHSFKDPFQLIVQVFVFDLLFDQ